MHVLSGISPVASSQVNWSSTLPSGRIPATISDGTSNTVFFTEKLTFCSLIGNPGSNGCDAFNCAGTNWADPVIDWYLAVYNWAPFGTLGTVTPAGCSFQIAVANYGNNCDPTRPSSGHTAVILAALGDGSVRNVSQGMAPRRGFWPMCPTMACPCLRTGDKRPADTPAALIGPKKIISPFAKAKGK